MRDYTKRYDLEQDTLPLVYPTGLADSVKQDVRQTASFGLAGFTKAQKSDTINGSRNRLPFSF